MFSYKSILNKVMPKRVRDLYSSARDSRADKSHSLLNPSKLHLIDLALEKGARSFADLGGMWKVNGGYSIYCADHDVNQVILVDFFASPEFLNEQRTRKNLIHLPRNFALQETAIEVNRVDCIMMFDVLLHQVKPDWDEVLKNYATQTNLFLIFNQQFTGAQTVRLLEHGREWYLRHAPAPPDDFKLFEKANELHPRYSDGRTYSEIHDVWQWGITDNDLKHVMNELGFHAVYEQDGDWWPGLEEIRDKAFIFERITAGSSHAEKMPSEVR